MRGSLLTSTSRAYIIIGAFLYIALIYYWNFPHPYYAALNIFTFTTFAIFVWKAPRMKPHKYTVKRLWLTVFFYSLVFVALYLLLSDYYTGNTYIFSEKDARLYEDLSFRIKGLSYKEALYYITVMGELPYDDWGAPMVMSYILKIIPAKLFINFIYVVLNTLSACMLFGLGRSIMDRRYAYTATLVYSISSYSIFFMGSFLKEDMLLFLVIASMYMLYRHRVKKNHRSILWGLAASVLILFFRPAVAFGIWLAYITNFIFVERKRIIQIIFAIIGIAVLFISLSLIVENLMRYKSIGDDIFETSTLLTRLVLYAGGLFGPFPYMIQIEPLPSFKPLYGAGLLFKLLLFFAFWKGFIYCIRKRKSALFPIFTFVIIESLGLIMAMDSLELRKALPHIPFFILAAFWFMYEFDFQPQKHLYFRFTKWEFNVCAVVVFVLTLMWNILNIE